MVEFCFYGLQPKWFERDRFYKVYATRDALYGAWLAGEICTWRTAWFYLLILAPLAYWPLGLRGRREACYDSLISEPEQFLARDRRNFTVPASFIRNAQPTDRAKSWRWKVGGGSTLTMEMHDGMTFDLIVMAPDTAEGIAERLHEFGYIRDSFAPSADRPLDDDNPYRAPQSGG